MGLTIRNGIKTRENNLSYFDCKIIGGDTFKVISDIEQSDEKFYKYNCNTVNTIVHLCYFNNISTFVIVDALGADYEYKYPFDDISKKVCSDKSVYFVIYNKDRSNGQENNAGFFTQHKLFGVFNEVEDDIAIKCSDMRTVATILASKDR